MLPVRISKGRWGPEGRHSSAETQPACVLDERRVAVLLRLCLGSRGEREQPGSDGDSLALRAPTDGVAACGHSHLAGKGAVDKKAKPESRNSLRGWFDLWPHEFDLCLSFFVLCENEALAPNQITHL